MGFLSKLFGGDAGATPGRPEDDPAGAAPVPSPAASLEASPSDSGESATTTPRQREVPRPAAAAPISPGQAKVLGAAAPKSVSTSALAAPLDAPAAPAAAPARVEPADTPRAARPTLKNTERQIAPTPPREAAPPAPRRAVELPRRAPQPEGSIITSAPELTAAPPAVTAPRPAASAASAASAARTGRSPATEAARSGAATDPTPPRAVLPTVSGEAGMLGARTRKDRTKSPGFYSNMAPAYGSQTVNQGAGPIVLKRTVVGVAPPPELASAAVEVPPRTPAEPPAAVDADASVIDADEASTDASLAPAEPSVTLAPAAANDVAPSAASVAPAQAAKEHDDELEKEETAPGVGHTPSRHDPIVRNEIPERDIELLVQFVMDVGLGLATEAWLGAAREAVGRLKAGATRLARPALDKALTQFSVELDAPNALSEERRGRILQQLVLVDLALPRPIDVSGQRQLRYRLIVQHLLSELAASRPLVAQRLRDDGNISLDRLARLAPAELAERVGLELEQLEQALESFREYLGERARRGPEAALLGKGPLVAQRLAELEASAELFEQVADGDDARAKRDARRRRQADIARVSLLLAEWGEAGILGEFERNSVQGKITRLRRWLAELPAS